MAVKFPDWIWILKSDVSRSREGLLRNERPWLIAKPTTYSRGHAPWAGEMTVWVDPDLDPVHWGEAFISDLLAADVVHVPLERGLAPRDVVVHGFDALTRTWHVSWTGMTISDPASLREAVLGRWLTAASVTGIKRAYQVQHVSPIADDRGVVTAGRVAIRTAPADLGYPAPGAAPLECRAVDYITAILTVGNEGVLAHAPDATGPWTFQWREIPFEESLTPPPLPPDGRAFSSAWSDAYG